MSGRRILLISIVAALIGLSIELWLLEHYESTLQWVPLVLIPLTLGVVWLYHLRPSLVIFRVFVASMAAIALVGLLGVALHYRGNVAFELEMYPNLKGVVLFMKAMRGATPALAPATMIYIGLAGIAYHLLNKSSQS